MSTFEFAEYAINNIKNRKIFKKVSDFSLPEDPINCYQSVYKYDNSLIEYTKSNEGSAKKFNGTHMIEDLPFDFDTKKATDSLDDVKKEVIAFCQHLADVYFIPINVLRIYFSGKKGFGVLIPCEVFGAISASKMISTIFTEIALEMGKGIGSLDKSIYQIIHLLRMPLSIHGDTQLYKIPLTFDEIAKLTGDQIRELAKTPRHIDLVDRKDIVEIPQCKILYDKWAGYDFESITSDAAIKNSKSEFSSLLIETEYGARDITALKICGRLIQEGWKKEEIFSLLIGANQSFKPPLTYEELVKVVSKAYNQYGERAIIEFADYASIGDGFNDYNKLMEILDSGKGIKTGYKYLDECIRGFFPGDLIAIQGKSGVGKSMFTQNIVHYNSKDPDLITIFFQMEMSLWMLTERALQIELGLNPHQLELLRKNDLKKYMAFSKVMQNKLPSLKMITKPNLSIDQIQTYIRHAEDHIGKVGLVVIDHASCIREKSRDLYQKTTNIAYGLQALAKRTQIPTVFLCHVPKSFSITEPLTMSSCKDSNGLIDCSDGVISMWQNKNSNKGSDQRLIISVTKNKKNIQEQWFDFEVDKKNLRFKEIGKAKTTIS